MQSSQLKKNNQQSNPKKSSVSMSSSVVSRATGQKVSISWQHCCQQFLDGGGQRMTCPWPHRGGPDETASQLVHGTQVGWKRIQGGVSPQHRGGPSKGVDEGVHQLRCGDLLPSACCYTHTKKTKGVHILQCTVSKSLWLAVELEEQP